MVKTVFIAGITGQDGDYLSELLSTKRYDVYGLVLKFDTDGVKRPSRRNTVDLVTDDLSDAHSIGRASKWSAPDEIRSLAALTFVPSSIRDFVMRIGVDVVGANRMMASIMEPEAEIFQRSMDL
jgi:GDP-D-mannose dehydratase